MIALIIFLVILALLVLFVISTYNSLVVLKTKVEEAFSGMDVFLKKRFDMIPNLVETVKGYMGHEKEVLENVTRARASVGGAKSTDDALAAQNNLGGALSRLLVVAEAYPELKADANFRELTSAIQEIEDDISRARLYYNGTVKALNTKIVVFPSNLIAGMFGITKQPYFEVPESDRANVKVSF